MVKSSQNEGGQKLKLHKYARYVLTFGQKHSKIKRGLLPDFPRHGVAAPRILG